MSIMASGVTLALRRTSPSNVGAVNNHGHRWAAAAMAGVASIDSRIIM
ncbi:hypothetical protein [Peterkaempfera bronchialis]|nr:hypothetical protein [Peterkaempfera bronchialis]